MAQGVSPEEEHETIRRAIEGDRPAFHRLYDRHHRRIYALALRLMTDRGEAEELTQDVFVAAWKSLADYRRDSGLSSWLHGIAVRLARQRWRSLLRRRKRQERFALDTYEVAVRIAMPTARVSLERALAALPARMRAALLLYAVEGHSQAETAELLGVAEGTVKAQVHQARARLRQRMEDWS